MNVFEFIDNIKSALKFNDLYYETKIYFCFDCRIKKELGFDKKMLDELKTLGILKTDKNRYTKVLKLKNKNYRWTVIDKEKFRSLERLISLGDGANGKNGWKIS